MLLSTSVLKKFRQLTIAGLAGLILASCGGGGGSPGTVSGGSSGTGTTSGSSSSSSTTSAPTITLDLLDSSGAATTSLTPSNPITARATVLDAKKQPVPNVVVSFATGGQLTTITPAAGTGLTDASGIATVKIAPKDLLTAQQQSGAADTVTASATVSGQTITPVAKSFRLGATSITLSLVSPSGGNVSLNAYDTTPIKVNVLANGTLYTAQPVAVSFSSACQGTKATLPSSATTFNGQAQVVYIDNGCGGTDTVTASVQGAPSVTATLNIAPPVAASVKFVSASPSDKSIVIQGAGGNGRTETALLTFQALDSFGKALPNQLVNFSVNSTYPVSLQSTSATTGADGTVTVAVNSGTSPTTFRVKATLSPGGQSTISDTVTVTTGQPIQAAVSLAPTTHNIEGWRYDDTQTTVTILLADQSGNPVADGTPVVFQTDSGAIGSSSIGGCLTTNGGCSAQFRSQNPRYGVSNTAGKRAGLATINASTTSSAITLTGQIGIFLSDSFVAHTYHYPSYTEVDYTTPTASTYTYSTKNQTDPCGAFSFQLEFDDLNYNPLPSGSTLSIVNAVNVTPGTFPISPATVLDSSPRYSSGTTLATTQGTIHTITVVPSTTLCTATGTADKGVGSFTILLTTPKGNQTTMPFVITYPAL